MYGQFHFINFFHVVPYHKICIVGYIAHPMLIQITVTEKNNVKSAVYNTDGTQIFVVSLLHTIISFNYLVSCVIRFVLFCIHHLLLLEQITGDK